MTDCRKEACASAEFPQPGESSSFSLSPTLPQTGGSKRQNVKGGGRTFPSAAQALVVLVFKDDAS